MWLDKNGQHAWSILQYKLEVVCFLLLLSVSMRGNFAPQCTRLVMSYELVNVSYELNKSLQTS